MSLAGTNQADGPTHVYHYTTIDGLKGILSDGKLWATDVAYMNDTKECIYADELVRKIADGFGHGQHVDRLLAGCGKR